MPKPILTRQRYFEFVEHAINRKKSDRHDHLSSRTGDSDFCQTDTFDEAVDFAKNGWDAGIKQLETEVGSMTSTKIEYTPSMHGTAINLPDYLAGLPTSMFECNETREFHMEKLNLYVPLSYSCRNRGDEGIKFSKSIMKIVNEKQAKYDLRLIGLFDYNMSGDRHIHEVVIKDFGERFVLNNLAFAFHPSFFRRLYFSVMEANPKLTGGYGISTQIAEISSAIRARHTDGDGLILPQLDSGNYNFDESDCVPIYVN